MDKILRCFLKFHELFYIYSLSSVDTEMQDTPKKANIIKGSLGRCSASAVLAESSTHRASGWAALPLGRLFYNMMLPASVFMHATLFKVLVMSWWFRNYIPKASVLWHIMKSPVKCVCWTDSGLISEPLPVIFRSSCCVLSWRSALWEQCLETSQVSVEMAHRSPSHGCRSRKSSTKWLHTWSPHLQDALVLLQNAKWEMLTPPGQLSLTMETLSPLRSLILMWNQVVLVVGVTERGPGSVRLPWNSETC